MSRGELRSAQKQTPLAFRARGVWLVVRCSVTEPGASTALRGRVFPSLLPCCLGVAEKRV